jgi:hypothetical protein
VLSRNLTRFFEEDTKARWTVIVAAALLTAAVGMGADLDGKGLETAEIVAAIAGGAFFLACVAVYVWRKW